jgi:hypothetical protein
MPGAVSILSPFDKNKAGVHPGESATRQYAWENVAALTVAEAALAGDEINSTYIASLGATKVGIYSPKNGQVAFEVRGRTDGTVDNDQNVIEMYAAAKDLVADVFFYRRVATLTFNRGTGEYWQTATDPNPATIFFCDELAVTNNSWLTNPVDCGVDASQDYASYAINTHGYARFAFIMSTKDANVTTHYVDVRRF